MTWAAFEETHIGAIQEILTGSDRVAVIVGGAFLDDTLRRTLRMRMRDHRDTERRLCKVGGPLGNMVPRIMMLFMLGAFEKPVRETLYGLAEIRNHFAHHLDASFDSDAKPIADAFEKLTLHEEQTHWPHHWLNRDTSSEIDPTDTRRDIFLVNLRLCLVELMRDRVSHANWSNAPLSEEEIKWNYERVEAEKMEKVRAMGLSPLSIAVKTIAST